MDVWVAIALFVIFIVAGILTRNGFLGWLVMAACLFVYAAVTEPTEVLWLIVSAVAMILFVKFADPIDRFIRRIARLGKSYRRPTTSNKASQQ